MYHPRFHSAKRHGQREPRGLNMNEMHRRKREDRAALDMKTTTLGDVGGDADAEHLCNRFAAWAAERLKLPQPASEWLSIEWDAPAEKTGRLGVWSPAKSTIRLAPDHGTRLDLLKTLAHELAHVSQDRAERFPLKTSDRTDDETRQMEEEAETVAFGLLRDFLDAHDGIPS